MRRLIVDGYNAVHAWPSLRRALADHSLEEARRRLVTMLSAYGQRRQVDVTVVFDSRAGAVAPAETVDGVTVVYGSRRASADHVIERLVNEAGRRGAAQDIVVATSDRLQRAMVAAMGCGTMATLTLEADVRDAMREVTADLDRRRSGNAFAHRLEDRLSDEVRARLEDLRLGRVPREVVGAEPDETADPDPRPGARS